MLVNIDEVAAGALVNAIAVAGRRLSLALGSVPRRRREHDLTVARWFGTYELTSQPPNLHNRAAAVDEGLAATLGGDEFQAALQELLAARLTDAPDVDAARAREVLGLTLIATQPDVAQALTSFVTMSPAVVILPPAVHFPTCRCRRSSSRSSGIGPRAGPIHRIGP